MSRPIRTHSNWADTLISCRNDAQVENIHTKDTVPFHLELGRKLKNYVEENVYLKSFCGIMIPFVAALYSTTITCWPQHNVILYPEYWYEPLGPSIISTIMIAVPAQLIGCSLVMKINFLLTIKNMVIMFLSDTCAFVSSYILVHIIWVYGAGYPHPMPFIGQFCWSIGAIMRTVSFWFLFPRDLRVDDKNFRRRIIAYFCFTPLNMFIAVAYSQLPSLFFIVPSNWQWCVGLLIPIFKKMNMFVNSKLAFKAAGSDEVSARIVLICFVGSLHGLSVSLLLPNVTTTTAYVVIFLDSIPNIWSFFALIKLKKRDLGITNSKLNDDFLCFTVKELFELLVPLVYILSFVIAYYGPNAEIFGNVKNDYWQYEKVEDLSEKMNILAAFILIDSIRGGIFAISLWITCKLNMFEAYCTLVVKYGIMILVQLMRVMNPVICYYLINLYDNLPNQKILHSFIVFDMHLFL